MPFFYVAVASYFESTNVHIDKDRQAQKVIAIEGCANLIVLVLKLVVGLSTGSLAIIGDAIHSLSDVANNVVAWFVLRLSSEPADREHPYGHRKFETLAVFGLASLLTVLGFELILRALQREGIAVVASNWHLGLMGLVILVNIALAVWERHWALKLQSDLLIADASHTFSDVLTTLVVIIGWQLSSAGYGWLDTVCALGVGGLVLYLAFGLFKRAVPALVDEYAIDPKTLSDIVIRVDGVREVKQVRSRHLGAECAIDMVITVDPELTIAASHDIADQVETLVRREFSTNDISIHVEPHR